MLITGIWGIIGYILGIGIGIELHYLFAHRKREKEIEELRDRLRAAEYARDRWKENLESTDKLLRAATDRADRLAAMNQGLTEDLAALKAYNPEEIEERLKKIREIRAEEERVEKLSREVSARIALSMLNSGGFGSLASACCSLADQQRISWR